MDNRIVESLCYRASKIWDVSCFFKLNPPVAIRWCSNEVDVMLLTEVGFPRWAAPNMHFNFDSAQLLAARDILYFGEDRDGRPLYIELETGQLFVSLGGGGRLFLANHFFNLFEVLIIYGEFVERCRNEILPDCWVSNDVPKKLIDEMNEQGKMVNKKAFTLGGFWAQEIDRLVTKSDEYY